MRMRYIVHNKNSQQLYGMFLHPVTGKRIYRSIGTADELAAARTSQALQQFIKDESWHTPTKVTDAVKIDAAAARLFYDPLRGDSWFAAHGTYCNWPTQDESGGWVDEVISLEEAARRSRLTEEENAELKLENAGLKIHIEALTEKCGGVVIATKTFADAAKAYLAWGKARGGRGEKPWSKDHARKRESMLGFWQRELELQSLSDIKFERVDAVVTRLSSGDKKKAPSTVAKHSEAIAALCDWCVERGYLTKDPLSALKIASVESETEKRALTAQEAQNFVLKCQPRRKLLYLTALLSGFRANELRQTEVQQLLENGIAVSGAVAKSRKRDYVPLHADLVALLRSEAAGKKPTDKLLFVPKHLDRGFAQDLKRAGIAQVTAEGKLSFHALRTTYLTWLDELEATAKQTQAMARHSTPKVTFSRYVKARTEDLGALAERVGGLLLGSSAGSSARPA